MSTEHNWCVYTQFLIIPIEEDGKKKKKPYEMKIFLPDGKLDIIKIDILIISSSWH